jgi:hypothetical protein
MRVLKVAAVAIAVAVAIVDKTVDPKEEEK